VFDVIGGVQNRDSFCVTGFLHFSSKRGQPTKAVFNLSEKKSRHGGIFLDSRVSLPISKKKAYPNSPHSGVC
jgi:hypothetical protein